METRSGPTLLSVLDGVGAIVSVVCAVHCLALPLILSALPLLGLRFSVLRAVEGTLLLVAILVALVSLGWGIRVHRRWGLVFSYAAAMATMVGSCFLPFRAHASAMAAGGALLAFSHVLNHRFSKACACCRRGGERDLPVKEVP